MRIMDGLAPAEVPCRLPNRVSRARAAGMQQQRDDGPGLIEHGDVTSALDLDPAGLRRQLAAPACRAWRQHTVARAEGDGDGYVNRGAVPKAGALGRMQGLPEPRCGCH